MYHQLYGGSSELDGNKVIIHLKQQPKMSLRYNTIKIFFPHIHATYNVNIVNDSGPDIMMVDFHAIPIFLPAPWII